MGCSSSINPSQVIEPRVPTEHDEKSTQVKNCIDVSTQTDAIQMTDVSIGVIHTDKQTDDIDAKVNSLEPSSISEQEKSAVFDQVQHDDRNPNVFLNSRLGANPRREKLEWNLFNLDALNLSSIIQRELQSIDPKAIQIALNAMKKAVELQNLPQDIWNLLEKAAKTNDPKYFILAYTHESDFYETLNQKLTKRTGQTISSDEILDQFGSLVGNLFQNLNLAINSMQAIQTGQTIPIQGTDETDWALLYLRPLYRLLLIPNADIRFQGQTYRGMWISRNEFEHYKDAEFICHKAVTSTSALRQVAQGFINRVEVSSPKMISVIFIYDINELSSLYALKIRDYSRFPEEEEVLILPGPFFKIVNINIISSQAAEIILSLGLNNIQSMFMDGMKSLLSPDVDDYD